MTTITAEGDSLATTLPPHHLDLLNQLQACSDRARFEELLLQVCSSRLDFSFTFLIPPPHQQQQRGHGGDGGDKKYFGTILHGAVKQNCEWKVEALLRRRELQTINNDDDDEEGDKKRKTASLDDEGDNSGRGGKRSRIEGGGGVGNEAEAATTTGKRNRNNEEEQASSSSTTAKIARKENTISSSILPVSALLIKDSVGRTALHSAAALSSRECFQAFISTLNNNNDDIDDDDEEEEKSKETLATLLCWIDNESRTILHEAARSDDVEIIKTTIATMERAGLEFWAFIDKKDHFGNSPIKTAAMNKNGEVLRALWMKMDEDPEKKRRVVMSVDGEGKRLADYAGINAVASHLIRGYVEKKEQTALKMFNAVKQCNVNLFRSILMECTSNEERIAITMKLFQHGKDRKTISQLLIDTYTEQLDSRGYAEWIKQILKSMLEFGFDPFYCINLDASSSSTTSNASKLQNEVPSFVQLILRKRKLFFLDFLTESLGEDNAFANRVDEKGRTIVHLAILENVALTDSKLWDWILTRFTGYALRDLENGQTALQVAAEKRQWDLFNLLLERCPSEDMKRAMVNNIDNRGRHVVQYLVNAEMIRKYEKQTEDIFGSDASFLTHDIGNGQTVLHNIAKVCDGSAANSLRNMIALCRSKEKMASILFKEDVNGHTFIDVAFERNNSQFIQHVLQNQQLMSDASIVHALCHRVNSEGQTFLHQAMLKRAREISLRLVSLDPSMCLIQDKNGRTVLHLSESQKDEVMFCTILDSFKGKDEHGIRLFWTADKQGRTVLDHALINNNFWLVDYSLQLPWLATSEKMHTALGSTVDNEGQTFLHRAAAAATTSSNLFIRRLISIDWRLSLIQDKQGRTPLHLCALADNVNGFGAILDSVQLDERKSQLLWIADGQGRTVVYYCLTSSGLNVADFVLKQDVFAKDEKLMEALHTTVDEQGQTVLHRGASKSKRDLVCRIISLDRRLCFVQDKQGKTPLHLAASDSDVAMFESILGGCGSEEDQLKLLWIADAEGNTAIDAAWISDNINVLSYIILRMVKIQDSRGKEVLNKKKRETGETIVHRAALSKDLLAPITVFLSVDPDLVFQKDDRGRTALHVAATQDVSTTFATILDKCGTEEKKKEKLFWTQDNEGHVAMYYALVAGSLQVFEYILNEKWLMEDGKVVEALKTTVDDLGRTVMHVAISEIETDLFRKLLSLDFEMCFIQDKQGKTALHVACEECPTVISEILDKCSSTEEAIKLLLIPDSKGHTAIYYALDDADFDIVEFILENDEMVEDERILDALRTTVNDKGQTILHRSVIKKGGNDVFSKLISLDFEMCFTQDKHGKTALHYAGELDHEMFSEILQESPSREEFVKLLLIRDNNGHTALHEPLLSNDFEWLQKYIIGEDLLKDQGILSAVVDEEGRTFLHRAVLEENEDIISDLMSFEQTLCFVQDKQGKTALHLAGNNKELFEAIVDNCESDEDAVRLVVTEDYDEKTVLNYVDYDLRIVEAILEYDCLRTNKEIVEAFRKSTVLHQAASNSEIEIIELLLKNDHELCLAQDRKGRTVLHCLCDSFFDSWEYFDSESFETIINSCATIDTLARLITTKDNGRNSVISNAMHTEKISLEPILRHKALAQNEAFLQCCRDAFLRSWELSKHGAKILSSFLSFSPLIFRGQYDVCMGILERIVREKKSQYYDFIEDILDLCETTEDKVELGCTIICEALEDNLDYLETFISADYIMNDSRVKEILLSDKELLHRAFQNENYNLVEALVALDNDLCFKEDDEGRTTLHLAVQSGMKIFSTILDACPSEKRQKLLFKEDSEKKTVIHYAIDQRQFGVMMAILDQIQASDSERLIDIFRTARDDDGMSVLHLAAFNSAAFEGAYSRISALDPEMCICQDNKGKTPLHYALEREEPFSEILSACETAELQKKLLLTPDCYGENVIHDAVRRWDFSMIKRIMKQKVCRRDKDILEIIRTAVDDQGQTILHRAVLQNDKASLDVFLSFAGSSELCFSQNKRGKTALHLAAERSDSSIFAAILNSCEAIEKKKALLAISDLAGRTVVHTALVCNQFQIFEYLLELPWLAQGEPKMITQIFHTMDDGGRTILHRAAEWNYDGLNKILSCDADLCFLRDKDGKTPLHLAAANKSKKSLFPAILESCKSPEEKKWLLSMSDNSGRTAPQYALGMDHFFVFEYLLKQDWFIVDNENTVQILRLQRDGDGQTILHRACGKNHQVATRILFYDDALCFIRDRDGRTPLHLAATDKSHAPLFSAILESCTLPEDKRRLLWMSDNKCRNVLHNALHMDLFFVFAYLLEQEWFTVDNDNTTQILRLQRDGDGQTIFHRAAQYGNDDHVFIFACRDIEACFIQDKGGRTPLHLAAENRRYLLMMFLDKCSSSEQRIELMSILDNTGQTFMHSLLIANDFRFFEQYFGREWFQSDVKMRESLRAIVDSKGQTILHRAIFESCQSARMLIANDPELCRIQDKEGKTPLHLAVSGHRGSSSYFSSVLEQSCISTEDKMKLLLEVRDNNGRNVLQAAMFEDSFGIFESLVQQEWFRNDTKRKYILRTIVDDKGQTVLHRAAITGNGNTVNSLIEFDSTLFGLKDNVGLAPLHAVLNQTVKNWTFPRSLLFDAQNKPRMNIDPNIRIGFSHWD